MAPQLLEGTVADRPRSEAIRKPRAVWPSNPVAALWGTMVGKKVVMAATGVVLVGFVIAHMLGNLKIFLGAEAIDAYAAFLRTLIGRRKDLFIRRPGLCVKSVLIDKALKLGYSARLCTASLTTLLDSLNVRNCLGNVLLEGRNVLGADALKYLSIHPIRCVIVSLCGQSSDKAQPHRHIRAHLRRRSGPYFSKHSH